MVTLQIKINSQIYTMTLINCIKWTTEGITFSVLTVTDLSTHCCWSEPRCHRTHALLLKWTTRCHSFQHALLLKWTTQAVTVFSTHCYWSERHAVTERTHCYWINHTLSQSSARTATEVNHTLSQFSSRTGTSSHDRRWHCCSLFCADSHQTRPVTSTRRIPDGWGDPSTQCCR